MLKYANFQVRTMPDLLQEFSLPTDLSVPDHCWDYHHEHRYVEISYKMYDYEANHSSRLHFGANQM